uniref:Peptidase_M13_N domain-containing protein n=1 Tax=Parastrongyloides trichosuri TaxID=131310 RepID=A0A0N4Z886_PARTI
MDFIVDATGIHVQTDKKSELELLEMPTNNKEAKTVLGKLSYVGRHIKEFSQTTASLHPTATEKYEITERRFMDWAKLQAAICLYEENEGFKRKFSTTYKESNCYSSSVLALLKTINLFMILDTTIYIDDKTLLEYFNSLSTLTNKTVNGKTDVAKKHFAESKVAIKSIYSLTIEYVSNNNVKTLLDTSMIEKTIQDLIDNKVVKDVIVKDGSVGSKEREVFVRSFVSTLFKYNINADHNFDLQVFEGYF